MSMIDVIGSMDIVRLVFHRDDYTGWWARRAVVIRCRRAGAEQHDQARHENK
jgi:hypothetical protein